MPRFTNARETATVRAALSISPFERSRWRLRRTRQAMVKAARFRFLFGWIAGVGRQLERALRGLPCLRFWREAACEERRVSRACGGLHPDTRIAYEPKPVALSPGPSSGYEVS